MKRPCRQTGNSVERGANYAPATLCDRVGGIAVPGSGTACFSGGCTPPHRDCERPNTAKAMSETRQKKSEKYTLSVVFRGSRGNRRGHRLRSMPPPEQKCPAAGTTPSGNGPKQKQPAAGTAPSGNGTNRNSPQPEQHRARTSRNKNSPQPERHRAGTSRNRNSPRPEQHRAGTSRNRNGPRPERHRAGTGRTETVRAPQRAADRRSAGMRRGFTAPQPAAAGCCRAPRANRPPALRAACP